MWSLELGFRASPWRSMVQSMASVVAASLMVWVSNTCIGTWDLLGNMMTVPQQALYMNNASESNEDALLRVSRNMITGKKSIVRRKLTEAFSDEITRIRWKFNWNFKMETRL